MTKFKKNGWVREHEGNIVFKKFNEICVLEKVSPGAKVKLPRETTKHKEIIKLLYTGLLKFKNDQVDFIVSMKSDLNNTSKRIKSRRFKKILKTLGDFKSGESFRNEFNLSVFGLARLFNCSPSNAWKICKLLFDDRLLLVGKRTEVVIPKVTKNIWSKLRHSYPDHCYYKDGQIIKALPNAIKILCPITISSI